MPIQPGLYYITNTELTIKDIFSDTEEALKAGVKTVQYREKSGSSLDMFSKAKKLKELCNKYSALFIVNDRIDIALAVEADGVHLGQDDLPLAEAQRITKGKMILGLSTHSYQQAVDAEKAGADYIGFGPVYSTQTKQGAGVARGTAELEQVISTVKIPVVAIGGVKSTNLKEITATGAKHAAIISEIATADSVYQKSTQLNNLLTSRS